MTLPARAMAALNRPIVRFLLVGGSVAALDFACFIALMAWGVSSFWANIAGMSIGFLAGLWAHHAITFRMQDSLSWQVAVRYGLSFGFNLILGTLALQLLLWLSVPSALAKFITIAIVAASNFVVSKLFVFRQP